MADDKVQPSGVLLVDKPKAWTSHDVVKFIRGFGIKKVGHCGTLDPAATGLLVVVLGRATKLSNRFTGQDKHYEGAMTLGIETFTQDAEGEVTAEHDWQHVTEDQVRQACAQFEGEQMQMPPMVSAKKQGGQKLYKLARQGKTVERESRPITVHEFVVTEIALPEVSFRMHCSKGTYVRTLAADIGQQLGCGAHLSRLRRTASGRFSLDAAYPIDEIRTWNRQILYSKSMTLETAVTYA